MFLINLKIALRNFLKSKGFFIINLFGLTIGLSIAMIVLIWVDYELNYDTFNRNYQSIVEFQQRLYFDEGSKQGSYNTDRCGGAIGPDLADHFPEIESFVRFGTTNGEVLLSYIPPGDTSQRINFIEKSGMVADSSVFNIFSVQSLKGNPIRALNGKNSIVLTEELAEKYFHKENPVGKMMLLNDEIPLQVTGVIRKWPASANMKFDFLLPFNLLPGFTWYNDNFEGNSYYTFFLLNKNTDQELLKDKITTYLKTVHPSQLKYDISLVPLKQVHIKGENRGYIGIYSLAAIALIILLTACINFINLTTARSLDRAKEVGIKKATGAGRKHLIYQFLSETYLVTLIAVFLSVIISELVIPPFNKLVHSDIHLNILDYRFLVSIGTLTLVTGLLSGLYPSIILSSFNPVHALKNFKKSSKTGSFLRKSLVVSQFVISIISILCALIFVLQVNKIQTADLGFNKDNLIIIPVRGNLWNKTEYVKQQLVNSESIVSVTTSSEIPDNVNNGEIRWGKPDNETNTMIARKLFVDYDFINTFQIKMKEGRFYSREFASDSTDAIVINQEVINHLGYKNSIGEPFYIENRKYNIIGVIDDFNFFPLNLGGKAILLPFGAKNSFLFVKYAPGQLKNAITKITAVCGEVNPHYPSEYYLYNDYSRLINNFKNSSKSLLYFLTPLALLISCLGLFGLSIFTAETKTKEIGIRKTFGASINDILIGQLKEFAFLIFLSLLISLPISHLLMNFILNFFSPRIEISPFLYIGTVISLFALTFLVSGIEAYKASVKNPVISLRYE